MKNLIFAVLGIFMVGGLYGQQLTQTTPIASGLNHIWNPAFTAVGTKLDASLFYRRQWLGFDGAPSTAVASIQYPFVDMNMSAGAQIIADRTGPVSKNGIQLNYAYKLRELLNRDDQLTFGINGYFHQFNFSSDMVTIRDQDDVLLTSNRQSKFVPAFGVGMAYHSSTEDYDGENIFYLGFSALQVLASDLLLEQGNAKRERHFFVNMGTKLFGYNHYIEPSLQVNFVNPEIINYILGAKFELEESFWAGLSYSSVADVAINGGVILNEIAGRYTELKIGVLANINGGSLLSAGPSFEFYASYTLDLD